MRRGSNARGIPVGVCNTRGMVRIVLRAHALLGQAKSYKLFTLARLTRAARVGTMGTIARHTDPGHTMKSVYVIREKQSGRLIECHDEQSREWAERKVQTHNYLYPSERDQWVICTEQE